MTINSHLYCSESRDQRASYAKMDTQPSMFAVKDETKRFHDRDILFKLLLN